MNLKAQTKKYLLFFKHAGIENIVLDEAHHLKNEWWKPLFSLKQLPKLISFTTS